MTSLKIQWFDLPEEEAEETEPDGSLPVTLDPSRPRVDWAALRAEVEAERRAAIAYVRAMDWFDGPFGIWGAK